MINYELKLGDCLEVLRGMPDNSVDSIVTDPPYGLGKEPDALKMLTDWIETGHHDVKGRGFMGKEWDAFVPQPQVWHECLRVLKPGGHLLAFAGTRTQDLMTLGLRLAGFEIRDMVAWVYGSGFPKSLDVSKALDKMAGAERDVVGFDEKKASQQTRAVGTAAYGDYAGNAGDITAPATDAAKQWDGWGTALKPALEPITLARKPLEGTVAANVLKWHTGALNIDGCRVEHASEADRASATPQGKVTAKSGALAGGTQHDGERAEFDRPDTSKGRWPANLIHDGSDEVLAGFPNNNPGCRPHIITASDATEASNKEKGWGSVSVPKNKFAGFDDGEDKSAARFFYCAKTSKTDRNEGLEDAPDAVLARSCQAIAEAKRGNTVESEGGAFNKARVVKNNHPTVKPTDLMRYLCRLVTPPEGIVLDPFMGSGSTGKAAMLEGFQFIGIERDAEYFAICQKRVHLAWVDSIDL